MPLQITALFAALLTLFYLFLSLRVALMRRARGVGVGDGGDRMLGLKVRVHANFAEYVPLALILMALMEMAQLPRAWLYAYGVALLVARLLHAHGLGRSAGVSTGRFFGTALTWLLLAVGAIVNLYGFVAARLLTAAG